MGWTEKTFRTTKRGVRPTTAELTDIYLGASLSGTDRFEVLAAAHKGRGRVEAGLNEYTLWLYGKPTWGSYQGDKAIVLTVLLSIDWAGGVVCFKDFGLDSVNVPPASFLKALPESLGDAWEDKQLGAIRARVEREKALKKALVPGVLVSFGEKLEFSNGMKARWLEVTTYYSRTGREMKGLRIDGTPVRVSMGRDWVSRVREYIPVGAVDPVAV